MEVALILFVLIIIIIVILVCTLKTPKSEIERLENNSSFNANLSSRFQVSNEWDFRCAKTVKISEFLSIKKPDNYSSNKYYQMISFDNDKKKILFVDYENKKYKIVDYKDLIDYQVLENNQNVTSTVGTALGNGWYSGFATSTSTAVVDNLVLVVRINSFDCPQVSYKLMNPTIKYNRSSKEYQKLYSQLQSAISLLEIVKKENLSK